MVRNGGNGSGDFNEGSRYSNENNGGSDDGGSSSSGSYIYIHYPCTLLAPLSVIFRSRMVPRPSLPSTHPLLVGPRLLLLQGKRPPCPPPTVL